MTDDDLLLLTWGKMTPAQRDAELARLSRWAWGTHAVRVDLLRRRLYVAIVKIEVVVRRKRSQGRATGVLGTVTEWADEHGVILGLTPSGQYGADVARLSGWYRSFGFTTDQIDTGFYGVPEQFYRQPAGDDGSEELAAAELQASIEDLHRKQRPRLRAVPRP